MLRIDHPPIRKQRAWSRSGALVADNRVVRFTGQRREEVYDWVERTRAAGTA